MFNRRYQLDEGGNDNPLSLYSSGFECGISPGILTASASILGGSQHNGDNYAARAMVQESWGNLNGGLGGSVLRRQFSDGHHRAVGAFWYLGLGPVTWLGQIDEIKQADRLGNLVTQEMVLQFHQGFDFRLTYNFQDPDRSLKNGTRTRYGAGFARMPTPFLSILAMVNYWAIAEGPQITGDSYFEGQLVVHLFY